MNKGSMTNNNVTVNHLYEDFCEGCPLFELHAPKVVRGLSEDGICYAVDLVCSQMTTCKILAMNLKEKEANKK